MHALTFHQCPTHAKNPSYSIIILGLERCLQRGDNADKSSVTSISLEII